MNAIFRNLEISVAVYVSPGLTASLAHARAYRDPEDGINLPPPLAARIFLEELAKPRPVGGLRTQSFRRSRASGSAAPEAF